MSSFLNKQVCQTDVSPGINLSKTANLDSLAIMNCSSYALTRVQMQSVISGYDFPNQEGVGILMFAAILNKPYAEGEFYTCFFDLQTKEIFMITEAWGKAGGFGLRNYWAKSVYNVLKQQKKLMKAQLKEK